MRRIQHFRVCFHLDLIGRGALAFEVADPLVNTEKDVLDLGEGLENIGLCFVRARSYPRVNTATEKDIGGEMWETNALGIGSLYLHSTFFSRQVLQGFVSSHLAFS